jgi:hypothetical protein
MSATRIGWAAATEANSTPAASEAAQQGAGVQQVSEFSVRTIPRPVIVKVTMEAKQAVQRRPAGKPYKWRRECLKQIS